MENNRSEFNYSEDIQMTAPAALYANDLTREFFQIVKTDRCFVLLLSLAMLHGQPESFYKPILGGHLNRIDYAEVVKELPHDKILNEVSRPPLSPFELLSERARLLATLPKSVECFGYTVPSSAVAENAANFILSMEHFGVACPDEDDVMPSSFGTVIIDCHNQRGLVSIEIGMSKVGFFTDYEDGINEESDGLLTDFHSIPESLLKHLISEV